MFDPCHIAPCRKSIRRDCPGTPQPKTRVSDEGKHNLSSAHASTTDPGWVITASS
jgi:hypothetical protein